MNPAVKHGAVALSTPRNRFTVSTPAGGGQETTASPTRLASGALGLERTTERTVNFDSSTWQFSIPNQKKPLQPCLEGHLNSRNRSNITPRSSSSDDNSRWSGTKKQKLGAIVESDRKSTFSWPNDPIQPRQGQNDDFSATKTSQPPQDSISVRTRNKQVSDAIFDHDSSPTRSLSSPGLNETFRSPSSGSDPILGNMKNASETTTENTLQKENTSSGDAFRAMELNSVIPLPCRGSIPSSEHTEDSMTSKDIVHSRRKSRGILHEEEQQSQTYLAAVWQSGKLAVGYYDADLCQIFMMPDIQENDEFLLFHKVLDQIQPKCIVIGSKQDDRLIKTIQVPDNASEDGLSLDKDSYLQVLPSIDFSAELCKRRILAVDLPTIPDHFTESDRTLYMSSLVPFENIHMVQAVGGLLKFLDKKRIGIELENTSCRIPILAFNIFTMQDMMLIDENTYGALQIFHRESHPSVYKAGFSNAAKEGLSLFGIMNRCRSQIGSKMLRVWFQRPTRDLEVLKQRQDAIAFFCCARNFEVTSTLMECQKNIKNISRILGRMTQSEASLSEWQALYKTVYNAIHIGDICRAQTSNVVLLRKIGAKFTDDLHRIGSLISKIVDFEESAAQGRFVVKVGVDPELDQKKRTYNGLPDFLTRVARDELNKLSNDITECNIQYLPQLGYLLAVPETEELRARDNYKIETLEFMFMSNKMLHYKSESTKELDLILGDTHSEIADHETGIMHRLQNTILEHSAVLVDVMRLAAELDCLLALAAASKEGSYVRPELLADKCIRIKGGRHPLQELCVPSFVPNDTFSDSRDGFMKILTGPNASGKSVYLKQVALIIFLAHIGSFVPAEEAHIGLTDAIYTRVRTQESVSVGLSTFMIDLNQVSAATRSATSNSLILLDEFGKGTETEDGLALLCSCLKFWLKINEGCPHVFVSTHFHSLVSRHLLPDSPLLRYQTMEVLRDDEGELVFLYQLVEGTTQTSYACHVATVAGIPKEIVSRGSEVSELIRTNRPIGRIDSPCNERQFERCKDVVNKFLELDLENDDLQVFLHDVVLPACQVLK